MKKKKQHVNDSVKCLTEKKKWDFVFHINLQCSHISSFIKCHLRKVTKRMQISWKEQIFKCNPQMETIYIQHRIPSL